MTRRRITVGADEFLNERGVTDDLRLLRRWTRSSGCKASKGAAMPKPQLREPYRTLAGDMAETFLAGCKRWRPDLPYPESHSDMRAGMDALLQMFEIKRRPIALTEKDIWEPQDDEAHP